MDLPAAFGDIAHSPDDEGQVQQPLKNLYHLAGMLFDGPLEKLLEIADQRRHHVFLVEEYLGLGQRGLFVIPCGYF